jgi:hypothetical protein
MLHWVGMLPEFRDCSYVLTVCGLSRQQLMNNFDVGKAVSVIPMMLLVGEVVDNRGQKPNKNAKAAGRADL